MELQKVKENYAKPPLKIKHSEIERTNSDTTYRSKCPECKTGALLMKRNQETLELLPDDVCVVCGRRFIYTDLKETGLA